MKTKQDLLKALKKANVPIVYKTLIRYENHGIVDRPSEVIKNARGETRIYTDEEIRRIVEQVKSYKTKT